MPAYSISCKAALAGRVSNAIRSIETPRVHHAARRRGGGVADCVAKVRWMLLARADEVIE
jgi:hypothetical protein